MTSNQPDLFGTPSVVNTDDDEKIIALYRARLQATLAVVKAAKVMPWDDMLIVIREDNRFRYNKDVLPKAEADALWAEFNIEMDRLYAIMNEGKEMPPLYQDIED